MGRVVEVAAAFGLPLAALGSVAVATLLSAFHLGGRPLQGGADLIGLALGHRALVTLGGLPAALAQPADDYDPIMTLYRPSSSQPGFLTRRPDRYGSLGRL